MVWDCYVEVYLLLGTVLMISLLSWENVLDYSVYVRFIRQHLPGNNWDRLSIEGISQ